MFIIFQKDHRLFSDAQGSGSPFGGASFAAMPVYRFRLSEEVQLCHHIQDASYFLIDQFFIHLT
jgi:hypothetical protein